MKTAQDIWEEIKETRNKINDLTTQEVKENLMFLKKRYCECESKSMVWLGN